MKSIIIEEALQELFYDLHASGNFADGKEISDMVLKQSPEKVLEHYRELKEQPGFDIMDFFKSHFEKAPEQESNYRSDTSLPVETHINRLWKVLTRNPDQKAEGYSSLVPLPYPYIVPGGRFNEIYYWDSYFTMLGLKVSGKVDLIESMVDNFTWLIKTYGFIPNGNRTYFRGRSQPPFYALMVELLAGEKGEDIYLKYLSALELEYQFWMEGQTSGQAIKRTVCYDGDNYLNRYFDNIPDPRTEMYSDDVELLERNKEGGKQLLLDIRAACESGWDFSSRWCSDPARLETLHTTDILPVDLNCLLYQLEKVLARSYRIKGDGSRSDQFADRATDRKERILELCWDPETRFFHDYDFKQKARIPSFHLAGMFPLFFRLATQEQAEACAKHIKSDFLKAGGLVTTTFESGQQWDAPNGWAPLQWITIQGLRNYGIDELAEEATSRWVTLNKKIYRSTGKLLEKYNVVDTDLETGGGEYPVQDGFGWTNGVLLALLEHST